MKKSTHITRLQRLSIMPRGGREAPFRSQKDKLAVLTKGDKGAAALDSWAQQDGIKVDRPYSPGFAMTTVSTAHGKFDSPQLVSLAALADFLNLESRFSSSKWQNPESSLASGVLSREARQRVSSTCLDGLRPGESKSGNGEEATAFVFALFSPRAQRARPRCS